MKAERAIRIFGAMAVLGGGARVVSSFIPWTPNSVWLEAFYLFIDINLLFGLIGFYFTYGVRLGAAGLAAFLIAASGVALIAGPDGESFGVDIYQTGVMVIAIGLSGFSILLLLRRVRPFLPPVCWISSFVIGGLGGPVGFPDQAFVAGGILFGLGFLFAGLSVLAGSESRAG